jgi:hypothetical protein
MRSATNVEIVCGSTVAQWVHFVAAQQQLVNICKDANGLHDARPLFHVKQHYCGSALF